MIFRQYHIAVLAFLIVYISVCYGGYSKRFYRKRWRSLQGRKVSDAATQQMLKNEIAKWPDAPQIDKIMEITETDKPNATVYKIEYEAPDNNTLCEVIYTKTKLPGNKAVKSHDFVCSKELREKKQIRNILV